MEEKKVSIIVPVYNVEKYLEECVESLLKQTYRNLEILLVDDGSPDHCPQMCDDWARRDSRIRVIHKQNAGSGLARNTGMKNASGEYICFFDSDDYLMPNAIEKAYAKAKNEQPAKSKNEQHQKAAEGNSEKSHKPHRRPNHHRRRKPKPAGDGKPTA